VNEVVHRLADKTVAADAGAEQLIANEHQPAGGREVIDGLRIIEPLDRFADPTGKAYGRLMMSRDGREMLTRSDIVYIDLGAEDKVAAGDYLTIYRPLGGGIITSGVDNE